MIVMETYRNPVLPGFYPDPSICRAGGDYYLVTSSFEYFPGIPIFHSRDLVHWRQLDHCLTRPSQLPLSGAPASGGVWAPTIRRRGGLFYVTATNVHAGGNFFVTASDPAGPWSEPVRVAMDGIDPSFTFDEDGKVYYTTNQSSPDGTPGISMAEIDPATGKLLSPIRFIWTGSGGRAPEAPHLYHIGRWYYLMIAEGGTQFTHMETIARSASPWGPYETCPHNPILSAAGTRTGDVHCTGHGDLVQALDGHWWMVHLGIRIARKYMSHLGRETFLSPVDWDAEGWPVVNRGECVELHGRGPLPPPVPMPAEAARDDFDAPVLASYWNTLRGPAAGLYSLTKRPGWLTLHGAAVDLDALDTPAFVGRRQRYFNCVIETLMTFGPRGNDEAGVALLLDNMFYYKYCVKNVDGTPCLVLEKHAEDFRQIAACMPAPPEPLILRIEADREKYTFLWAVQGETLRPLATASTRFLACEVAGRSFTGTYAGLYATGRGKPAKAAAWFDYFVLEGHDDA